MSMDPAKYEIILYWSDEDAAFICEVPELPGFFAHGITQHLALENTQAAMHAWLNVATEVGREIPIPKGRKLMFA